MTPTILASAPAAITPVTLPAERILNAYREGYAALLVTGRSLYDLVADANGVMLTVVEHLRRRARGEHGMATITYSLANGLDWDAARLADRRDVETIETVLRSHQLLNSSASENEIVQVMRGISSLVRTPSRGLAWADGGPLRFLVVLEFAEHLMPNGEHAGRTDQEIRAVELATFLAQSNALRESGNLVLFHGHDGRVDTPVSGVLRSIHLVQPNLEEKTQFLDSALRLYATAKIEDGLSTYDVARLTANTPNQGLEARVRASHRSGAPITATELLDQKSRDVISLSEETLSTLDVRRLSGIQLVGTNIRKPLELLLAFGEGLLHGNQHIPANVVLVGPPGTGKTDLAILAAEKARASAYQIHSPKGGVVGETERKSRLLMTALGTWTPNIAFIDELTEALPMQRSDFDGDSGASKAVTAAFLTALSDESRRGRSLVIGTTNCPWRMGTAMRSRFTMIPVMSPLLEDYPAIIAAVTTRIAPRVALRTEDLVEAGNIFHAKGASAREIRAELSLTLLAAGYLDANTIFEAARNLCPNSDRSSSEHADLWAIRACTSKRFLPRYRNASYRFPSHVADLVDAASGEVNWAALDKRIRSLQPSSNV